MIAQQLWLAGRNGKSDSTPDEFELSALEAIWNSVRDEIEAIYE